jgi:hypothetical protein
MIDLVELDKSLDVQIQTMEKGTNTNPTNIKSEKDAYIEMLSITSKREK